MTFLSWGRKIPKCKPFSGEDENHSVQTQGENEKDEIGILFFLQNLERNLSQKYFFKKNFFF